MEKFEYLPIKCNVLLGKLYCQKNHEDLARRKPWGDRKLKSKVKICVLKPLRRLPLPSFYDGSVMV